MARRLGGGWLQILMNAPVLGILGYVGWVTVKTFFSADYLTGDYFLHAFWVIAIALLLSFFALQVLIRLTASPSASWPAPLIGCNKRWRSWTGWRDTPSHAAGSRPAHGRGRCRRMKGFHNPV